MAVNIAIELLHYLFACADPGFTVDSCQVTAMRSHTHSKAKLYRVNIEGRTTRGPHTLSCTRSLVCKCLPASEGPTTADVLFGNELSVYTKALPALLAFQECNVEHVTLPFRGVPACYLTRNDRLVLEDLDERGFKMAKCDGSLDHAHCVAALHELARFHALSLAMKRRCPHRFHSLVASAVAKHGTPLVPEHDELDRNHQHKHGPTHSLAKGESARIPLDANNKYKMPRGESLNDSSSCSRGERMAARVVPRDPMVVLCHGDCRADNIMFRYSDEGDILEVCLVGFQAACYESLVLDLSSLLSCCSCHDPSCLLHLLEEYHSAVNTQLKQLLGSFTQNLDLAEDDLLNPHWLWKMLLNGLHHCGPFGFAQMIEMSSVIPY